MKTRSLCTSLAVVVLCAGALQAAGLDPRLAPLAPLVGRTWRAEMSPPDASKPVVDVHRFELALGKDGPWADAREVHYREDATAVVRFKD